MEQLTIKVLIGMLVGTLVGMTGLGGGVLLLPLLIFGLKVPPIVAVGSDALVNFVTKIGAGTLHAKKGTVNWRLVRVLASGSVPGAIAGVALLARLRSLYGEGVNDFLKVAVGALLVIIPFLIILQNEMKFGGALPKLKREEFPTTTLFGMGLMAGVLVGITSVGSGSVVMVLLLVVMRQSPSELVGSDIMHAMFLTGATSFLHFQLGTIDTGLVVAILIGSIPGALIGTALSTKIPVPWMRRILCGLLLASGARMIWP